MTPTLEIIAAVLILANVALAARESVWCWPVGIAGVALYLVVFFRASLYSSAGLQVVFLALNIYGWYEWTRGGGKTDPLRVTRTPAMQWPLLIAVAIALTLAVGWTAQKFEAALPYADAAIAGVSVVALWMQARKQIEHWFLWMAVDVVAVATYWSSGLRVSAALYVALFALCCWGVVEWRRSLRSASA